MDIGDRVRELREFLGLSQTVFGNRLSLERSAISLIERKQRNITERTIKDICREFSANEEWLRNGAGPMIVENDSTIITQLAAEYNLDSLDRKILKSYLNLTPPQRAVIKDFARSLVAAFDKGEAEKNIDAEVEAYRKELEAEQKGEMSSALDDIKKDA